ncbi:hypothetical protein VT84_15485 [Gemmata sp. SH-PL17]|uniref:DUF58 domain-containing protein n=1 Tax=Gemmata sp. SH-PL17 TaxID=1630693 RepID=UPI0004B7E3A4|nr:DUF58 domain-containing protein [Gemmata sp. SH-PL17]AMV25799.1 hypothetical protein VT84_15485 [Gemmata sp. SH-PL17]
MLTARGWWFVLIVGFLLVFGAFVVPYHTAVPAILSVTLFVWFVWEWVQFHFKSNAAVSRLRVRRWVMQGGRDAPMLWANVPFEVRVRVRHDGFVTIDYAVVEDRLPSGADIIEGETADHATIAPGEPADVIYTLKCPAPGVLRFEGVKVRVADLHGFFYRRVFLRDAVEFLVLPPLMNEEGRQRADKRFNTLPPPGIHRLRRPGSGDELLDLRDYRPGDPPKMIAWKASARKDKLITKEYESDVPVRCVLFLDTSEGVRLGPPGNTLLTRMAGVAAVVAQASTANRDLVGLTTFDDQTVTPIAPARTQTHTINVMRRLAEVSALQPGTKGVPAEHLTRRAYPLAHELYPELMAKPTNSMPLSRLWIPLLEKWWGWIVLFLLVVPPCLLAYRLGGMFSPGSAPLPTWLQKIYASWMSGTFEFAVRSTRGMQWALRIAVALFIWANLLLLPSVIAGLFWFIHGFRGWFGPRAGELTRRKRLSALFSLQDGTGPDAIERYVHDDEAYAERVAQFLQYHHLRCPIPLYDEQGRYRFRCAEKAEVLGGAIIRAVGRARDNELYVILADLAELGPDLEPLVKACRVARARRHHVMVIVPWPADVASPDVVPEAAAPVPDKKKKFKKRHPDDIDQAARHKRITKIVQDSLTRQYHESFRQMRRALSGVGATVMRVNDGDPVRLVLDRLDRLRGMRSRR